MERALFNNEFVTIEFRAVKCETRARAPAYRHRFTTDGARAISSVRRRRTVLNGQTVYYLSSVCSADETRGEKDEKRRRPIWIPREGAGRIRQKFSSPATLLYALDVHGGRRKTRGKCLLFSPKELPADGPEAPSSRSKPLHTRPRYKVVADALRAFACTSLFSRRPSPGGLVNDYRDATVTDPANPSSARNV